MRRCTRAYINFNPRVPSDRAVQRDRIFTSLHRERGILGRNAHRVGAPAAASYHLDDAVFCCEHAPSVLEILLHNSVEYKYEHTLKGASNRKKVMKNQCPNNGSQTSKQPV